MISNANPKRVFSTLTWYRARALSRLLHDRRPYFFLASPLFFPIVPSLSYRRSSSAPACFGPCLSPAFRCLTHSLYAIEFLWCLTTSPLPTVFGYTPAPTAQQLVYSVTNVYNNFSFKLTSDGSKYKLWCRIFKDICTGAKVLGHITGKSKPASEDDEDWASIDSRVKS